MNRQDYEAAGGNWDDTRIRNSMYALQNGEFTEPTYTKEEIRERWLALQRLNGLKSEYEAEWRASHPAKATPIVDTVRASCGHSVPRAQLMTASQGTACPDCYDRMSE